MNEDTKNKNQITKVENNVAIMRKEDIPQFPLIADTLGAMSHLVVKLDENDNPILQRPPREMSIQEYLNYKLLKQIVETKEPIYKQMETLQKLLNQNSVKITKASVNVNYDPFITNPLRENQNDNKK